jgi:hypothetical protein
MRSLRIAAAATAALLAIPALAAAHGNGHGNNGGSDANWKKGKWDARAELRATATGEDAAGQAFLKQRTGTVTIALKVVKLDPLGHYKADIHTGADCAAPGAQALALPDLYADERGVARLWITLPTTTPVAMTGFLIDVHSTAATPAQVTCGAIKGATTKGTARVKSSVAGGTVKGFVAAKQNGPNLKVEIHLRGLVASSVHAQHFHTGSCDAQGPIVVPLPDATADADGDYDAILSVTDAAANVTGKGYIYNIHEAASPTVGASLACGNMHGTGRALGHWWFTPRWWAWF